MKRPEAKYNVQGVLLLKCPVKYYERVHCQYVG